MGFVGPMGWTREQARVQAEGRNKFLQDTVIVYAGINA